MAKIHWPATIVLSSASAALTTIVCAQQRDAAATPPIWTLHARVIATGLHGAQGIRQVGRFHTGGPLTSNPEFLLQTQSGRPLDPERVLVAVEANLGAKLGNTAHAAGSVLSIDPRAASDTRPLIVPADLAARAATVGAPVQIYSTQSARHLNRLHNGGALTAGFTAVSGPRYLSINNAFGRPWVANAPFGLLGAGSESVVDPDGAPLANAPSDVAGGVFVGRETSRTSVPAAVRTGWLASLWNRRDSAQLTPGAIDRGALGTALLGASPDGSGFAVFAVVTGAGAVAQIHVQDGVDGLAAPGTIDVGNEDPGVIGVAFKWSPDRALFIADARHDRIQVLYLDDDARQFTLKRIDHLESPWLRRPVDLAAAIPEIANPRFASHTTLAAGSDLYVANRGDGSLVRLRQDGSVTAAALIDVPGVGRIGPGQLRSIAVSADAQRIWLVAQAAHSDESLLIEVHAFDAAGPFAGESTVASMRAAQRARPSDDRAEGARLFVTALTPRTGLGPVFNADSCVACHPGPGGASAREEHFARRVARMDPSTGRIRPIDGQPSAFAPRRSTREMGERDAPAAAVPRAANVVSLRMPLSLFAAARLDEIPDAAIEAQAVSKGDGIKGRVHHVGTAGGTQGVGRYGWKADVATLEDMVAEALDHEMGVTSALAIHPPPTVKDDGSMVRAMAAFVRTLTPSAQVAR
jgi:hypothetical protein